MALADAAGPQRDRDLLAGGARGARTHRLHARQAQDPAVLADQAPALGDGAVAHDGRLPPRQQHGVPRRHLRPRDPDAGAPGDPRPGARRLRDGDGGDGAAVRAPGAARGVAARAASPRVRGGRAQRAAPRPVRRARRSERAGDRRALAVRRTLPARVRLQDPDLRRPAPGDRERAARPEGGERRSRDPRVARVDGDGDADRRVRRPERRQADRRRPRGDGAPAAGRAPRAGRASDPRVRRRADGAGERARRSRVGAHRRLGRGLPRVDVRRGRRGRSPVPAPGRGLRLAVAFDAGRSFRRS